MDKESETLKLKLSGITRDRVRSLREKIGLMQEDLISFKALCRSALTDCKKGKFHPRAYSVWLLCADFQDFEKLIDFWEKLFCSKKELEQATTKLRRKKKVG